MIASYLALKSASRDKKRTLLLVVAIAILLMVIISVSIVKENALSLEVINAEIERGRWHLAYVAKDPAVVEDLEKEAVVESATLGYRLESIPFAREDYNLALTLFQRDKLADFTRPIINGTAPKEKGEILVPDWALRRFNITELPATLSLEGMEFSITGVYKGRASEQRFKELPAYGIIETNEELLHLGLLAKTPTRDFDSGSEYILGTPSFVYIRLAPDVMIIDAVEDLKGIRGLDKFPKSDMFSEINSQQSPIYNQYLISVEGRGREQLGISTSMLVMIIRLILLGTLFVMVYVAMSIVIRNNVSILGLYSALGINPKDIRNLIIFQALFCAVLAMPLGILLGVSGTYLILGSSVKAYLGSLLIPWLDVGLSVLVCLVAIVMGAAIPAVRASLLSPLAAVNVQIGVNTSKNSIPPWLKLDLVRGKKSFSVIYGLKQVVKEPPKLVGFTLVIAALLSVFTLITADIERQWMIGNRRQSYQSDHVIAVPYITEGTSYAPSRFNPNVKAVDRQFKSSLNDISVINNIYYHHGVVRFGNADYPEGVYHYDWRVPDKVLTPQGRDVIRSNYPMERKDLQDSFIAGGISGYGNEELTFAQNYLVDGSIDIELMAREPVILLSRYITAAENIDIPYTTLQVGDSITLVESVYNSFNRGLVDIEIVNEYTFTIGGFVDTPPFPPLYGGSGFVGIMHIDQLEKLQTAAKGIIEIYVDDKSGHNSYSELRALSTQYGYDVWTNHSFERTESQNEYRQYLMVLYTFFTVLGLVLFLAVFSLFSAEILARKQEFAMLDSIGMTKGQVFISVLTQGLLPGILGSLLGCLGGIMLINYVNWSGTIFTTSQLIPKSHLMAGVLIVLGACLAATLFSVYKTIKEVSVHDIKGL